MKVGYIFLEGNRCVIVWVCGDVSDIWEVYVVDFFDGVFVGYYGDYIFVVKVSIDEGI